MPELAVLRGFNQRPVTSLNELDVWSPIWIFAQMVFRGNWDLIDEFRVVAKELVSLERMEPKPAEYRVAQNYLERLLSYGDPVQRGIYAGESLLAFAQMHQHGPIRKRAASREQAYALVGYRHGAKDGTVRKLGAQHKPMAHYWAAFCLIVRSNHELEASPALANRLLFVGQAFLTFGVENDSGPGVSASPLLDADEAFRPPEHLDLGKPELESLPPLTDEDIQLLWNYTPRDR